MTSLMDSLFALLQKFMFWWVRIENIEKDYSELNINPEYPVVYVMENRSLADALAIDQEATRHNLPSLTRRLTIPGVEKERSVLSLKTRNSPFGRAHGGIAPKLRLLIQYLEENPEQDIALVPVCLIWGRGPNKEKSFFRAWLSDSWGPASRIRKAFTVLFNGRNTYLEINEPISLRQLADEADTPERSARKVNRVLRVHFRRARTRVVGPDLSHRRTLLDGIMRTPNVQRAIKQTAQSKKISAPKATKLARKHAEEIAANVSFANVRFMDVLLTRLWNKIYNGIEVANIEPVRELAKDAEIIYAPCHRSHIDYLLLSYCLYYRGLNIPHIAAGNNLNMPVVGGILRRGGAFFMRRTFRGDKLYAAIFNEYLHTVFTHGFPVEYFVEGGRSRTGRTLHPKAGMLTMTLKSYLRDNHRDMVIVPVYIGYEKVFEGRTYLGELRGKKKEKENVFGLLKTFRHLKNFGKVSVNFGDPINMKSFLSEQHPGWESEPYTEDARPQWLMPAIDQLAVELVTRINAAAALNPVNMVALVLLAAPRQALDEETLLRQLNLYHQLMADHPFSDKITLAHGSPMDWINSGIEAKKITRFEQKELGNLYGVEAENAVLMTYYRNNVLHLFAIPSLIACIFSNQAKLRKSEVKERFRKVYPYIMAELFLPWGKEECDGLVDAWLEQMLNHELLSRNRGGIYSCAQVSAEGSASLDLLAQLMMPTLERYFITISVLRQLGSGHSSTGHLESRAQQMAERLSILNGLNAPEFFDKSLFRKFIQQLRMNGILQLNAKGLIEFDDRIDQIAGDADQVLRPLVIQTISQVTSSTPILEHTGDNGLEQDSEEQKNAQTNQ